MRSSYLRRAVVPRVLVVLVMWSGGDLPPWLGMIRGLLSFPSRRMIMGSLPVNIMCGNVKIYGYYINGDM